MCLLANPSEAFDSISQRPDPVRFLAIDFVAAIYFNHAERRACNEAPSGSADCDCIVIKSCDDHFIPCYPGYSDVLL